MSLKRETDFSKTKMAKGKIWECIEIYIILIIDHVFWRKKKIPRRQIRGGDIYENQKLLWMMDTSRDKRHAETRPTASSSLLPMLTYSWRLRWEPKAYGLLKFPHLLSMLLNILPHACLSIAVSTPFKKYFPSVHPPKHSSSVNSSGKTSLNWSSNLSCVIFLYFHIINHSSHLFLCLSHYFLIYWAHFMLYLQITNARHIISYFLNGRKIIFQ